MVAIAGFFVVLEVALGLFGVRPVLDDADPFVGFSSYVPLYVERSAPDGPQMVTAPNKFTWFNEQQFAKRKPPGAFRIFCLGGSTTYGRPYDDTTSFAGWLRELLAETAPDGDWEVVNAGGISYASYRVATLMEELRDYDPDLFVVYTGHNEFLEQRTYGDAAGRSSTSLRQIGSLLAKTRTFTLVRRFVNPRAEAPAAEDRFEMPEEVDAILDRSVGPEVYTRDDPLKEQVISHFRFNLARMSEIARDCGAKILFVVPASNLRDCSPFKSENRDNITLAELQQWKDHFERAGALFDADSLQESLEQVNLAAALDARHAGMQYLRARVLERLEQSPAASSAYIVAREEDVCPLRALHAICRVVRESASELNVPVVDFEAIACQRSPQGIPGDNLFIDHVHPTIDGNRLLAVSILETLSESGIVDIPVSPTDEQIDRVRRRIESRVDQEDHGLALRNLSKVLGWAGKFEEADRLALQAVELIPDDANARFLAGNACIRLGELDRAVEYFRQALQLNPTYAATWYSLGVVYYQTGRYDEAIDAYLRAVELDPETPAVHHNLGLCYELTGQTDLAVSNYEEAIRRRPRRFGTYNNLGVLYAMQSRLDKAGELFRKSLEINPRQADALTNLGRVDLYLDREDSALKLFRDALILDPQHVAAASNLAWVLATSPSASRRNGQEAVRLAQMCVEQPGADDPNLLSILAAAYAEAGDFDAAVDWQRKALERLGDNPPEDLQHRLERYEAGQPYRDHR